MKELTMSIPDMQSAHCQTRVSNAVKGIRGVQIVKQEAGSLSVSLDSENIKSELVTAIEKAGYAVTLEENLN